MQLDFQGGGYGWYVAFSKSEGRDGLFSLDQKINSLLEVDLGETDREDKKVALITDKEQALKMVDDWELMEKISEEL